MPQLTREYHLIARPIGSPTPEDFRLVEHTLPDPGPGQVLVRNDWMSVDPAMRGRMNDVPSYVPPFDLDQPMTAQAVGTVIASEADDLPVGAQVLHSLGFREHAILDVDAVRTIDTTTADAADYLGVLGITGLTAYAGLTRIAPVREGDVVFISGAAGAVGSVAARVARHLGASRVIGSAGGPEKAGRLVDEFGFDAAIDYRAGSVRRALAEAAPDGIDVYFDNVGGDHLAAALTISKPFARFALCGMISQYNADAPQPGPSNLALAVSKRLTLRGFIVLDHFDLFPEWSSLASGWLADGSLVSHRTVVEGLDHAVDALLGLFTGANTGKMLVRLSSAD